ncbi:MAG: DUF5777 family beta-barrel protein [Bacteroidia bacterium]
MRKKLLFPVMILLLLGNAVNGQKDDLLSMIDDTAATTERIKNAFKSTRVINTHSSEMLAEGVLDFRILHRFGEVSSGVNEFWGLDQASMRMSFDYGIKDWLTVGIGRSTYKKEVDGLVKVKLLWQTKGKKNFPFSLTYVVGTTVNTLPNPYPEYKYYFSNRVTYYHELLFCRKFNSKFTLQITPTLVHYNYVEHASDPHDLFSAAAGARYKVSKRIALVVDYNYRINKADNDPYYNYFGFGVDIETGGHVFQLHFTNSIGMNERAYITETSGEFLKGDIRFGFNLSRVFTVKDRKNKSW